MKPGPSRRAVLQGAAATLALAAAPACRRKSATKREPRALADDLRHLILVIGPWTASAMADAEALIPRYLSDERMQRFQPDAASFAQLAARFADHGPAAESLDLAELSAPERAALVALTTDLYAIGEVRFAVTGAPEPGLCLADPLWHTTAPQEPDAG